MALPTLLLKKDALVMVDWTSTTGVGIAWRNFCGASSVSLTIDNAVQETVVSDCDDWTLPPVTIAAYGAQTVTASIEATMTVETRNKLLLAAKNQLLLPVRISFPGAVTGEIQFIDGALMLPSLTINGLANNDGQPLAMTINGRFKSGVTFTNRV